VPGMEVKKITPTIFPRVGMLRRTAGNPTSPRATNKIARDNRKHFLISQSLGMYISSLSRLTFSLHDHFMEAPASRGNAIFLHYQVISITY